MKIESDYSTDRVGIQQQNPPPLKVGSSLEILCMIWLTLLEWMHSCWGSLSLKFRSSDEMRILQDDPSLSCCLLSKVKIFKKEKLIRCTQWLTLPSIYRKVKEKWAATKGKAFRGFLKLPNDYPQREY